MAITLLSEIGGEVIVGNWLDEEVVVCKIASSASKAGWAVKADGTAVNATGNLDEFVGFLLPTKDVDVDTAPATGAVTNIVIPQSGHLYNVYVKDTGTVLAGEPLIHNTSNAGQLQAGAAFEAEHVARIFRGADNDRFMTIIWGV